MKPTAVYRVVAVRTDGKPVLIAEQTTRRGAEAVLRLIERASPYVEVRIEGGPALAAVSPDILEDDTPSRERMAGPVRRELGSVFMRPYDRTEAIPGPLKR
jgi:hypothetical protein